MITRYWLGDTLFWKFSIEQHMYAQYQRCTLQLLKKIEFIQNISHKVVVVLSLVQKGQLKHFKEMYICSPYPQCSCWLSCNDLLTNIPIVFLEWNTLFMRKKNIHNKIDSFQDHTGAYALPRLYSESTLLV